MSGGEGELRSGLTGPRDLIPSDGINESPAYGMLMYSPITVPTLASRLRLIL